MGQKLFMSFCKTSNHVPRRVGSLLVGLVGLTGYGICMNNPIEKYWDCVMGGLMKKLMYFPVILMLLICSIFTGVTSASATVTEGRDPQAAGCSADAYSVASWPMYQNSGVYFGSVELRYSPKCGTNWLRGVVTDAVHFNMSLLIYGPTQQAQGFSYGYSSFWSGMVSAPGNTCVNLSAVGYNNYSPQVVFSKLIKKVC